MRECLSSAARNQRRVSMPPTVERLRGSKFLTGAVAPPMSSRADWRVVCAAWCGGEW